MKKLKSRSDIFKSIFIYSFIVNAFYIFFIYIIYICIYIYINLLAKYYPENKERLQKKKARKRYQNFSKEEKKVTLWLRTLQKYLRR